jgi:hypothetical protein
MTAERMVAGSILRQQSRFVELWPLWVSGEEHRGRIKFRRNPEEGKNVGGNLRNATE